MQVIIETIEIDENGEYVIEADESIVNEMRARLNKTRRKKFSYKDGDHLKDSDKYEKIMRERQEKMDSEKS